jgi:hypothetical protein
VVIACSASKSLESLYTVRIAVSNEILIEHESDKDLLKECDCIQRCDCSQNTSNSCQKMLIYSLQDR